MTKHTVDVTFNVEVETDDSKFDKDFMESFSRYFCELDTIEEHVQYLAQLHTRGLTDGDFIEGYGSLKDMGIKIRIVSQSEDMTG